MGYIQHLVLCQSCSVMMNAKPYGAEPETEVGLLFTCPKCKKQVRAGSVESEDERDLDDKAREQGWPVPVLRPKKTDETRKHPRRRR